MTNEDVDLLCFLRPKEEVRLDFFFFFKIKPEGATLFCFGFFSNPMIDSVFAGERNKDKSEQLVNDIDSWKSKLVLEGRRGW